MHADSKFLQEKGITMKMMQRERERVKDVNEQRAGWMNRRKQGQKYGLGG